MLVIISTPLRVVASYAIAMAVGALLARRALEDKNTLD
jgi:hypothetical protein